MNPQQHLLWKCRGKRWSVRYGSATVCSPVRAAMRPAAQSGSEELWVNGFDAECGLERKRMCWGWRGPAVSVDTAFARRRRRWRCSRCGRECDLGAGSGGVVMIAFAASSVQPAAGAGATVGAKGAPAGAADGTAWSAPGCWWVGGWWMHGGWGIRCWLVRGSAAVQSGRRLQRFDGTQWTIQQQVIRAAV